MNQQIQKILTGTGEGIYSPFWLFEIGGSALSAGTTLLYHHYTPDLAVRLTKEPRKADTDSATILYAFGDPIAGVKELAKVAEKFSRPSLVMIDQRIYNHLPQELLKFYGPYWGRGWEFFYALKALPEVPGVAQVIRLPANSTDTLAALPEIEKVLRASIKHTHALDQMEKYNWFIHRQADGRITAAMGAEDDHFPNPHEYTKYLGVDLRQIFHPNLSVKDLPPVKSAHFAGLGADPEFKGLGYGTAVIVGAINWYLNHSYDFIRFGMWDWNDRARKLYNRLGISHNGSVIFGRATENLEEN